jgi:hypothetical protein
VAVPAVNSVIAHMMPVRKLHGLLARDISLRDIRRPIDLQNHPEQCPEKDDRAEDADSGNSVRTAVEDLGHSSSLYLARPSSMIRSYAVAAIVRENGATHLLDLQQTVREIFQQGIQP